MTVDKFSTPMMQQYASIKERYKDCVLFFRLGDFYEMFLEDAHLASKVLNITLTQRNRGSDGEIPMAGIPYHSADNYLNKFVSEGYKVAICEQLSAPDGKGIVERDVIRIVTPGTLIDDKNINTKNNNFICSFVFGKKSFGFSVLDLSTGDFYATEESFENALKENVLNLLTKFNPSECILLPEHYQDYEILKVLSYAKDLHVYKYTPQFNNAFNHLTDFFEIKDLEVFGIKHLDLAVQSSAKLLDYISYTQKVNLSHIKNIQYFNLHNSNVLDRSAIVNLELISNVRDRDQKGSLLSVIDKTQTSMGGRTLKHWLLNPLTDLGEIEFRHSVVAYFVSDYENLQKIILNLKKINDIERLLGKIALNIHSPKDIIALKKSLDFSAEIASLLLSLDLFSRIHSDAEITIKSASKLKKLIESFLTDDAPYDPKSGELIREGYSENLDKLKLEVKHSKQWIKSLESTLRKDLKISNLKVKYNKVFGYFIEVTKTHVDKVPSYFERKQTLVNAERFITLDLKKHEDLILNANEKIVEIEVEIYSELVTKLLEYTLEIQSVADFIAFIDCITSFSFLSLKNSYVQPTLLDSNQILIKDGRHPVVEDLLNMGTFVPNSTDLSEDNQLDIITGPNMGGKSVYLRQVALICLLNQIGCFVPAKYAELCVLDKIFVRSGASDMVFEGLSTFMVEMIETSYILNNLKPKSLIIMDEIGRGTSTFDGISIARSVAQYLVDNPMNLKPLTLFATHYFELQTLAQEYSAIHNYTVSVENIENEVVFLHKIIPGKAKSSFGIEVAKLAGVPKEVVDSSYQTLKELKNDKNK
jgi:DNA mismatch repair protein MutS